MDEKEIRTLAKHKKALLIVLEGLFEWVLRGKDSNLQPWAPKAPALPVKLPLKR